MSQENVEIVREAWDAWLRGDMDSLLSCYDPEVVWNLTHFRDWPDNTYRGHQGVRRFLEEWLEVWDDYEAGVEEIRTAPDGRVVSLAWQRGRGRQSGLAMEIEYALIVTVRDGMILRLDNYDERSDALEAAGLSE
jgi:ketosteroid isomerase-like protein